MRFNQQTFFLKFCQWCKWFALQNSLIFIEVCSSHSGYSKSHSGRKNWLWTRKKMTHIFSIRLCWALLTDEIIQKSRCFVSVLELIAFGELCGSVVSGIFSYLSTKNRSILIVFANQFPSFQKAKEKDAKVYA